MSYASGDLKLYLPATPLLAWSPPTALVGGAKSATQITGASISELHVTMPSALDGGGTRYQYAKWFVTNTSSTNDLTAGTINLPLAIDDSPAGPFTVSATSDSASDDNTRKIRYIGTDTFDAPLQFEVTSSGLTEAVSSDDMNSLIAVECRNVSTGALVASVGNQTIKCGSTVVAVLLAGYYSMTSEIKIGLVATLDDTTTTTDGATAPSGITFTKPRTVAAGIAMANSGALGHGVSQGGWSRWAVSEMRKPSMDIQVVIQPDASTY